MTVDDYRKRAEDCVQQAQGATEPARSKFLHLAQCWLKLADEGVLVPPMSSAAKEPSESPVIGSGSV
jgi:hypothetical protein